MDSISLDHPADVIRPTPPHRMDRLGEVERHRPTVPLRPQHCQSVAPWADADRHMTFDRHREDEAVVVVGVFADQIHAAWRACSKRNGDRLGRARHRWHLLLHAAYLRPGGRVLSVRQAPLRGRARRSHNRRSHKARSLRSARRSLPPAGTKKEAARSFRTGPLPFPIVSPLAAPGRSGPEALKDLLRSITRRGGPRGRSSSARNGSPCRGPASAHNGPHRWTWCSARGRSCRPAPDGCGTP